MIFGSQKNKNLRLEVSLKKLLDSKKQDVLFVCFTFSFYSLET